MANLFEKKDRHIIPNWRSFKNTANLGELNGSHHIELDTFFKPDMSDLIEDWQDSKNIGVAGDILGAAFVCDQRDNETVVGVAKFVLKNEHLASDAIINAAKDILKPKSNIIELSPDIKCSNLFDDKTPLLEIHMKISELKGTLTNNPYNPIAWVEMARYYSILGQEKQAERSIRNALFLSPNNRFVLRSVARFFVHVGDIELAHNIIRKSTLTTHDPWLLATEIALSTMRDQNSRFAKKGLHMLESREFDSFNITELASSLATLELKNLNLKKSKKLFKQSLIKPNDNSLAQAEWASQKERKLIPVNPSQFEVINSFEAFARDFSEQKKWKESIEFSRRWFFDLPFSKMAVLFGNEIAFSKLKDDDQAVKIAKLGLLSHPNDAHLLNNIIYSLCRQNKTKEAETYFKQIKKEDIGATNDNGICLIATRGLYQFRIGNHDAGRELYLKARKMAQDMGNKYLGSLAFVNYTKEEILAGEEDVSEAIPGLYRVVKKYAGRYAAEEAQDTIELYNKKKS